MLLIYKMSANRKPSKATDDEITKFHLKTKNVISKTGMYFDPITGKFKKALKQNGKEKGSARSLVIDTKYGNYLKEVKRRIGEDAHDDIKTREEKAKQMGFSKLQKERKLFGKATQSVAIADVVQQTELQKKAQATKNVPTNVKTKLNRDSELKVEGKTEKAVGSSTGPGQYKLKNKVQKKRESANKLKKETRGKKPKEVIQGSSEWYVQQQMMQRARAEKQKKGSGEEAMKKWRRKQQIKYGLPPTATKNDIMESATLQRENDEHEMEQAQKEADDEVERVSVRDEEAKKRDIENGNMRKKRIDENLEEEQEQADKIQDVVAEKVVDPLLEHVDGLEHADVVENPEEIQTNLRGIPEDSPDAREGVRRKGDDFIGDDGVPQAEQAQAEQAPDDNEIPLPEQEQADQNVKMKITEKEIDVEVNKDEQRSYVSPASERVSMERNRMKYSPLRLYEECRSFVKIYSDDIKTKSWKKIKEDFKKLSQKSPAIKLRKIHREMEEEVIEYYQGRQGIRLGVIIDPSVLGIDIGQLQGLMNPQMPMAMGSGVRQIGTQQQRVKDVDVHYNHGGVKAATHAVMPEGENLERHQKDNKIRTGRIKIPIRPPNRWLLKRSAISQKPINLKIR